MGFTKKKKYAKVSGFLPELVRHKGWQVKLEQHSFFPVWEDVVGEDLARCSRPVKVVKNVLWLEVDNSTWMQQLQFDKMRILEAVNSTLSKSRIKDIKFTLPTKEAQDLEQKSTELTFVAPDQQELKKFEQQVGCIKDDAARESLVRLWYLTKACRRQ